MAWTDLGSLESGSTLADAAAKTRIFVGDFLSDGSPCGYSGLTKGGKLTYQPLLCGEGSTLTAVWQENEDNDWFGATGSRIVCQTYRPVTSWGSETVLYSGLNSLNSVAADYVDGTLHVAYAMDMDGDLTTSDDIEIFVDGQRVTNNDTADTNVCYVNHVLYWYSDGTLMADGQAVLEPQTVALSDRFVIVDDNGVKALLFTQTEGLCSTLYVSWCDGGVWCEPVALTDGTEYLYDFTAAVDSEGILSIVLCATAVDESAEEPYGENALRFLTVTPGCDLVLEAAETDGSTYVVGKDQVFDLTVSNCGTTGTQAVLVEVLDGDVVLAQKRCETPLLPAKGRN